MEKGLHNIDCLKGLFETKSNSVQLVVTSPPYNLNDKRYYKNYEDNKSSQEYINWLKDINTELFRVLKDDGVYCLNLSYNRNSPHEYLKIINDCVDMGFILRETVCWLKKGFPITEKRNFTRDYEFIFILTKSNDYKTTQKVNQVISNVWKIKNIGVQSSNNSEKFENSINNATFPIEFPRTCMKYFTEEHDLVLDPFMGTGTTALASIECDRQYLGFELDKETYDFSLERVNSSKKQNRLNDWF